MKPWNAIHALKQTPGKNDKAKILQSIPADSDFWIGGQMALDPFTTYGIKKLPERPEGKPNTANMVTFRKLCDQLSKRELTGNAAKAAVAEFAGSCTSEQWEWWYSRILDKDLDCGVQTSFSKHAPEQYKVYEFACNLATDIKNVKDKHIPQDAFLESKYDGVRTLWFVERVEGTEDFFGNPDPIARVRAFSRNGKEFHNFDPIAWELGRLINMPGFPKCGIVIDGEVVSRSFNELMTQAQRKSNVDFKGRLLAFDLIAMDDFLARRETGPLKQRRESLEHIIGWLHGESRSESRVELSHCIKGIDARDQDRVMDFYQVQVQAGWEGIIIKDANSPYVYDRDVNWLKIKPTDTWDLTIVGYEEGIGRNESRLGAFICQGTGDKGEEIHVKVGSGLSDEQRESFWTIRDELFGQTIEVMADSMSRNQNGTFSLRFPRFIRFRDDK